MICKKAKQSLQILLTNGCASLKESKEEKVHAGKGNVINSWKPCVHKNCEWPWDGFLLACIFYFEKTSMHLMIDQPKKNQQKVNDLLYDVPYLSQSKGDLRMWEPWRVLLHPQFEKWQATECIFRQLLLLRSLPWFACPQQRALKRIDFMASLQPTCPPEVKIQIPFSASSRCRCTETKTRFDISIHYHCHYCLLDQSSWLKVSAFNRFQQNIAKVII